jgi:glutamyl-tRNA reductase
MAAALAPTPVLPDDRARDDDAGAWRAASRLRTAASGARTVVIAPRRRADAVADAELGRLAARAPALDDAARDEVRLAIQRVVDAFLAPPITRLTSNAGSSLGESYADAVRALFALDGQAVPPGGPRARPDHRSGRTT